MKDTSISDTIALYAKLTASFLFDIAFYLAQWHSLQQNLKTFRPSLRESAECGDLERFVFILQRIRRDECSSGTRWARSYRAGVRCGPRGLGGFSRWPV